MFSLLKQKKRHGNVTTRERDLQLSYLGDKSVNDGSFQSIATNTQLAFSA